MRTKYSIGNVLGSKGQNGAVLVTVTIAMLALLAFAALAIDVSHLYVVKNELQNAADAGALAAARVLYIDNGTTINTGANQVGIDTATANNSDNLAVEVGFDDVESPTLLQTF